MAEIPRERDSSTALQIANHDDMNCPKRGPHGKNLTVASKSL